MEKALFEWESWDAVDAFTVNFAPVTLKIAVGRFPAGTRFDCACVDFGKGVVDFYNDDEAHNTTEIVASFKLALLVCQEIPRPRGEPVRP